MALLMSSQWLFILVLGVSAFPFFLLASSQNVDALTLAQAITLTLKNQPSISLSELNVEIQSSLAEQNTGVFDVTVDQRAEYISAHNVPPNFSENDLIEGNIVTDLLELPEPINTQEFVADTVIAKRTRAGTLFSAILHYDDLKDPRLLPFVASTNYAITFRVEQPLLRGYLYSRDTIAELTSYLEISAQQADSFQSISRQILNTITQYWEVVAAVKYLAIRRNAEIWMKELVDHTRRLIEENIFAAMDINQPLAELARAQLNRVAAEQDLFSSYQALEESMGLQYKKECVDLSRLRLEEFPPAIAPIESCGETAMKMINFAMEQRFDIRANHIRETIANYWVKQAYNEYLPQLNAFASATKSYLYERGRRFPCVKYRDFSNTETDYRIGIHFSTPIPNHTGKGYVRQREAERQRAYLTTQQTTQRALFELKVAIANTSSLKEELKAANEAVEKSNLVVDSDMKKLRAGLVTLFDLLADKNRLVDNQLVEVDVMKVYAQNIANLRFLTATLLESKDLDHVVINNVTGPLTPWQK